MQNQNWKNITIVLLSATLVISIVIIVILTRQRSQQNLNGAQATEKFSGVSIFKIDTAGPSDEGKARHNVEAFRTSLGNSATSEGVYYTDLNYFLKVYPLIIEAQKKYVEGREDELGIKIKDYDWGIGCYWMLNKDFDGEVKLDFCFAPIMIHHDSKKVVDFFRSKWFKENLEITIPRRDGTDTTIKTSVFNTGNMFP